MFDIWSDHVVPPHGDEYLSAEESAFVLRIRKLPKIELHVHVEGSIHPRVLNRLARNGGRAIGGGEARSAESDSFFQTWQKTVGMLQDPEDFEIVAEGFVAGMMEAGVVWVEAFVSPSDIEQISEGALSFHNVLMNWLEAFDGLARRDLVVKLVVDLVRLNTPELVQRHLDAILDIRQETGTDRIVGISLGGPEQGYPLSRFEQVCRNARNEGLVYVAHAGETSGPEDIRTAMYTLNAARIGHAVALVHDDQLYRQVLSRRIPIDGCLTSNLRTRAVPTLDAHPMRRWIRDGANVTVNTDDPALFKTELALEYLTLKRCMGIDLQGVVTLLENAARNSTMPDHERQLYLRRLEDAHDRTA